VSCSFTEFFQQNFAVSAELRLPVQIAIVAAKAWFMFFAMNLSLFLSVVCASSLQDLVSPTLGLSFFCGGWTCLFSLPPPGRRPFRRGRRVALVFFELAQSDVLFSPALTEAPHPD